MTLYLLEQFSDLKREIRHLEKELSCSKKYKEIVVTRGSLSEWPYTRHNVVIQGIATARVLSLERRLKKAKQALEEIEKWIESIDNSRIRQIVELKYIKGYTWQRVATALGKQDESTPRRIMLNYFQNPENPENAVV